MYHAIEDRGGTLTVTLNKSELTDEELTGLGVKPGRYVCLKVSG